MKNVFSCGCFLLFSTLLLFSCTQKNATDDLITAIKNNDLEAVKKIADERNINGEDVTGATPMMWAAFKGNVAMVQYLHEKGGDCKKNGVISVVNTRLLPEKDYSLFTAPINAAAGAGHLDVVKYLIEKCGISSNEKSRIQNYYNLSITDIIHPLELFAHIKNSSDPISEHLKKDLLPCPASPKDACAIGLAIKINNFISENEPKQSAKEKISEIPIIRISENRATIDKLYGKYLIPKKNYSYLLDEEGAGPIIFAAYSGNSELVKYLLSKGADINTQSYYGVTALFNAGQFCDLDLMEYLLRNGASANTAEFILGVTPLVPLYFCEDKHRGKYLEKIRELLPLMIKNGLDINKKNFFNYSIFDYTCLDGNPDFANMLMSFGANPDLIDDSGKSARMHCEEKGITLTSGLTEKPTNNNR